MSRSRQKVFHAIKQHQHELRRLGVRTLQLFGSAARDQASPSSDVDFLVELNEVTFDSYMDVKLVLEDIFGCSIDLVLQDNIKPRLRDSILEVAIHAPGF